MIKKISTFFLFCLAATIMFVPRIIHAADPEFVQLRIAAVIANEIGGNTSAAQMVGSVMQERYQYQNRTFKTKTTWADILFGNDEFQNARGLASKNKEELTTYVKNKAGGNWADIIATAKKVHAQSMPIHQKSFQGKTYHLNSFMQNFSGTVKKDKNGNIIQTSTLANDAVHHDYFWQQLGQFTKYGNYKYFDENGPDESHAYDSAYIDKNINGATGNYQSNPNSGKAPGGANSGGGSSGGGGSRPPASHRRPSGADNAELCALDAMTKIYLDPNKDEKKACWYCNVVVVLTNAYLNAAKGALPTTIALGELIVKLGFMIWLAYYILQQVSSFAPIMPSKVLQEILVMGFKVALAYLGIKYAETVIVEYYINPIGQLGTDYGNALYDKLMPLEELERFAKGT